MRMPVAVLSVSLLLVAAGCPAARQARPDLPAPEYEPARAMPSASAPATAKTAEDPAGEEQDDVTSLGEAGGGKDKDVGGLLGPTTPESPLPKGGVSGATPPRDEKKTERRKADKPSPAATPEAPPSPTTIQPAPPSAP